MLFVGVRCGTVAGLEESEEKEIEGGGREGVEPKLELVAALEVRVEVREAMERGANEGMDNKDMVDGEGVCNGRDRVRTGAADGRDEAPVFVEQSA